MKKFGEGQQPFYAIVDIPEGDAQELTTVTDQVLNSLYGEFFNLLKAHGINPTTTTSADLKQVARAVWSAVSAGNLYKDTGSSNVKNLTHIKAAGFLFKNTNANDDGFTIEFLNKTENTGAVTVNVFDVENNVNHFNNTPLVNQDGSEIQPKTLAANSLARAYYDKDTGKFILFSVQNSRVTDNYVYNIDGLALRDTVIQSVDSISALANITKTHGRKIYVASYYAGLKKGGGVFVYDSTKASVNDGGNVINGWVRQVSPAYLNVMNFGAKGDGVTNDYPAFKAVSDYVKNTNLKGYTIHLPTPDDFYAVSGQTFEAGKGFINNSILDVSFSTMQDKLILLHSDNTKIKQMSGQYFGAFNKNTKEVLNTVNPIHPWSGANYDAVKDIVSVAGLGFILHFQNIKSLIINGKIDLDGNRDGMIIGGKWGDAGWQVGAYGIRIAWVKQFDISNINSHHHCCDGIYIAGWNDTTNPDIRLPDVFGVARNLNSQYNSRQALSLTGGQNLSFYDSTFDKTGLPEFSVRSMPMQNLDIEAEVSPVRNVSFYNCFFGDTPTVSVAADVGDEKDVKFYNCKVINSLGSTIWVNKPQLKFYDCYFNGGIEKQYGTEIEEDRTLYVRCTFTDDPTVNPNFTNPDKHYLLVATGANPKLIDCTFNLYKSGFIHSYGTSARYPMLLKDVIVNAYVAGKVAISGVGTIRWRDYRPQESRTDQYITFANNKITIALDKTDDIGNKFMPWAAYATVNSNVEDPDYLVFAPQVKKLDAVENSTLTDDTATKLNALLAQLKAKGYM